MQATERLLAGAIGSASARVVVAGLHLRAGASRARDARELIDEASRAILAPARADARRAAEHPPGHLRLRRRHCGSTLWNRRFLDLLDLPAEHGARRHQPRGDRRATTRRAREYGPAASSTACSPAAAHPARRGRPDVYERRRPDGTVLEVATNPLPSGGFVAVYTDVTERYRAAAALREANEGAGGADRRAHRGARRRQGRGRAGEPRQDPLPGRRRPRPAAAAAGGAAVPLGARRAQSRPGGRPDRRLAPLGRAPARRAPRGLEARQRGDDARAHRLRGRRRAAAARRRVRRPRPRARPRLPRWCPARPRCAATRRCCGASCRTSSPTPCATPPRGRILSAAGAAAASSRSRSGTPASASPRTSSARSSSSSTSSSSATAERGQGLGLGLAIVERLAGLMGHPSRCARGPARGSCFAVRVPRAAGAGRRGPAGDARGARPSTARSCSSSRTSRRSPRR